MKNIKFNFINKDEITPLMFIFGFILIFLMAFLWSENFMQVNEDLYKSDLQYYEVGDGYIPEVIQQ